VNVIVFDSAGGLRMARKKPQPILAVHANGHVTLANPYGEGVINRTISAERVQNLLHFIVGENRFFEINAEQVRRAMDTVDAQRQADARQNGVVRLGRSAMADSATITIRVSADDRQHEVTLAPPTLVVRQYPKIAELGRLRAIQIRLIELQGELLKQQDP
jgi:hypothetical protein